MLVLGLEPKQEPLIVIVRELIAAAENVDTDVIFGGRQEAEVELEEPLSVANELPAVTAVVVVTVMTIIRRMIIEMLPAPEAPKAPSCLLSTSGSQPLAAHDSYCGFVRC